MPLLRSDPREARRAGNTAQRSGRYSKMKEDVAFRLKQAETAGLDFALPPRSPMLSVSSVKMNYKWQLRMRRDTLIERGKKWSRRLDLNYQPPGADQALIDYLYERKS